jgi:hypothetical protein
VLTNAPYLIPGCLEADPSKARQHFFLKKEAKTFVYLAYALGQRERLITKVFSSLSGTGWSMRNLVDYTVIARPTRLGGTVQIARAIGHHAADRLSAVWHSEK